MKALPFPLFLAAAGIIAPLLAVEAPDDTAPPPPAVTAAASDPPEIKLPPVPDQAAAKTELAFLGVISSELPEVLANHLNVQHGIVVRGVMAGGPAEQAGLEENDIITSLAGTAIASPAELSTAVSRHKPGERVTLDLIHKGKASKIELALGQRPNDPANADLQPGPMNLDGIPKELADRVRDAMAGKMGGLDMQMNDQALDELRQRMLDQLDAPPGGMSKIQMHGSATIRMKDGEGSVEIRSNNGDKQVTVRDHQDNVTWTGPWNNDADKNAAPGNIRMRVDSLNLDTTFQGNGLRLQLNQPQPNDHHR
jgi:serine protease Do